MTASASPAHPTSTWLATVVVVGADDVGRVRRAVSRHAQKLGFGAFDTTRLVTASSELARNMLGYAGGGSATVERLQDARGLGLRVSFVDTGPGIEDLESALSDGFSSGSGLGLGLGGARRLVDELEIESNPGRGTRVAIVRRLPGSLVERHRSPTRPNAGEEDA